MSTPFYDLASLVVVPSGYKSGKVYAQKPQTTDGQLAFTRASSATRVASNGLIEKVRTNLYPRGSALLSTGWTSVGATLTAGQTDPNGGTTALRVQLAAAQTPYAYIFQNFTGSAATYTRSVFIKGATAQSIRIVDPNSDLGVTVNLTTSYQRFTSVAAGTPPNFGIQFDNDNDDAVKDFTIAFVQMEEGDIATPYIPTTTAAVSVGPVSGLPRLDYLGSTCPRLLLEPQRTNLALFSEQYDNASWTKTNVTITANNLISPDGFQNADLANFTSGSNSINTGNTFAGNASVTISTFVKAGTISIFRIRESFYTGVSCVFDLSAQTTGAGGKIDNYGNGWYRCSFTYTLGVGQTNINWIFDSNTAIGSLYLWGAQAEVGAYATSYIPTLGASVTRVADAASKTGISSLIGQTGGTIFFKYPNFNSDFNSGLIGIDDGSGNNRILFYSDTNNRITAQVRTNGVTQQPASYSVSGDVKVAIAYDSTGFVFYVNGTLRFTGTAVVFSSTMSVFTYNHVGIGSSITNQALLFKTRLTNAQLTELTAL